MPRRTYKDRRGFAQLRVLVALIVRGFPEQLLPVADLGLERCRRG
jgi:hypothetical protein